MDAPLVRRPRVLRPAEPPSFERRGRSPVRLTKTLPALAGYTVEFGRERWQQPFDFLNEPDESVFLRWRKTQASIGMGGRNVGALEFVEFDAGLLSDSEFFDAMDSESYEMMRLASVLLAEWRDLPQRVLDYGRILEITWVWVEPGHPRPGIWLPVLEALVARIEPYLAVVVAKAFPLEFENGQHKEATAAFERRRQAMTRYYSGNLGLQVLPGPPGEDGWMWRPGRRRASLIPPPRYRKGQYRP